MEKGTSKWRDSPSRIAYRTMKDKLAKHQLLAMCTHYSTVVSLVKDKFENIIVPRSNELQVRLR